MSSAVRKEDSGQGRHFSGGIRHSLTGKITLIMVCLVAGTALLCWILNNTLLERYYISNKQRSLQKVYEFTSSSLGDGSFYEDGFRIGLERLCAKDNVTMMIMNSGSNTLFFLGSDEVSYKQQFWEILFAANDVETELLHNEQDFVIGKYRDSRLNSEYLILCGYFADGNLVLMRTALESIQESVDIANRFLAYIGIGGVILSAVISYFVTRRITGPIRQLAELSRRMTGLDFDAKFQSRGRDEIDLLGQHMNELSETLEETISELKSANNELLTDIEKRNEMDDMRREFLANVSHELKTPLALIQGYAEGLKECVNEDSDSREFYCEVIMDEADKMNHMVKQLLSLNQLEFGNEMVAMERFDVTELIAGVIQATAILREQNGISLEYQRREPIYVWADEFRTEEVLTNFMSNAIHYAAGSKHIEVTTSCREGLVRIGVFNTGEQIPPQEQERIWTKFYKVDKARTREYGGSGIGLSIVKAIMDSFHQQCGVRNLPTGVEFWFELDISTAKKTELSVAT